MDLRVVFVFLLPAVFAVRTSESPPSHTTSEGAKNEKYSIVNRSEGKEEQLGFVRLIPQQVLNVSENVIFVPLPIALSPNSISRDQKPEGNEELRRPFKNFFRKVIPPSPESPENEETTGRSETWSSPSTTSSPSSSSSKGPSSVLPPFDPDLRTRHPVHEFSLLGELGDFLIPHLPFL